MDNIEAKRNLNVYRHNIATLQQLDISVLSYAEKEVISAILRRLKQLEKNVEEVLYHPHVKQ